MVGFVICYQMSDGCGDDEPWGRSPCQELMQVPDRTREPVKFLQT